MATDSTPRAEQEIDKSLLLDDLDEKFAAFQAFRKNDAAAADQILDTLGAQDDVDRDIVLELSAPKPLWRTDKFPHAHALAVRTLEVLDRNGARPVQVRGLGPIGPVTAFLVQQVAQFIVRTHQAHVANEMLQLYQRREANCMQDDPGRRMLMRARIHMERIAPGFRKNALGVTTFLLTGAFLSTVLSFIQRAITSALSSLTGRIAATLVFGVLMIGVAWVILRGAAVARRRIKLTLDGPVNALWETIGRCGTPPRDPSRVFGLVAVILALLPWLLIPTGLLVSWLGEIF